MINPSQVAIVCLGDELYGIGTAMRLYAEYMPDALFLAMQEGPLTEQLRHMGRRVEVAGVNWSFVAGTSVSTLARMPGFFRQAKAAARHILPLLQRHGVRVFHSQWLSQQLIGGYLRRDGILNIWHIQNNTNRQRLLGMGVKLNHLLVRRHADILMPVSDFIAHNWEGCGQPVVTVRNAAKPLRDAVSPLPPVPPKGPIRCLVAGRLDESKGHHLAVEAVIAARKAGFDVHLDVFGGPLENNPYAEGLRTRIAETGNQGAIELKGFVTDLRERHRTYHLGMQCRIDPEPCSLWVCETHADGLPLLASASGGTPELVVDGQTGLLFEPGNQAELTSVLQSLLREPEKLMQMRIAAFERGKTVFHPSRMINETLAVYELAEKSAQSRLGSHLGAR